MRSWRMFRNGPVVALVMVGPNDQTTTYCPRYTGSTQTRTS